MPFLNFLKNDCQNEKEIKIIKIIQDNDVGKKIMTQNSRQDGF